MIGPEDHAWVSESLAHCSLISMVELGLKFCFEANLGFHVTMYVLPTYCIELFNGRQKGAALSSVHVGKPVLAGAVSPVWDPDEVAEGSWSPSDVVVASPVLVGSEMSTSIVVVLPSRSVVAWRARVGASVVDEDNELLVEELDEVTELLVSN
jgi:hypothetical protein